MFRTALDLRFGIHKNSLLVMSSELLYITEANISKSSLGMDFKGISKDFTYSLLYRPGSFRVPFMRMSKSYIIKA